MSKRLKLFVFDTETTGCGKDDRIVEFAIKECTITAKTDGQPSAFSSLVNPRRRIGKTVTGIHGIRSIHVC
jgi:DNA polymerase III epsilon subunit-like protein